MKQKRTQRLKRVVSGLLSLTMITSMSAVIPANAEEEGKQAAYPYTVFAADENGGITLNLDYLTVNGNGATNGVYSTTAMYPNINGTISENEFVIDEIVSDDENTTDSQDTDKPFDVSRDMIYIHNKLMDSWFNNAQNYAEDYTLSEMNINLNSPVYVTGRLNYEGNVALNSAIGAVSDVNLSGGNLNGNNAVIYSKFGDIKITDSQASMNGLIYAPFGTVTIDCDNFNLNGLIIAQNVVVNSTGANINYSNSWAEFVGTETEELSWTFADWKYLADTDEDGLPNLVEKEIGTKPYEADTDGDLLPDGYEVLSLGTDPLKVDTDDNDISDYDEDFDTDGLSNGQEYEIGTRPYNDDSDGDNLKDGDEVNTYFTDPLDVDTDDDNLNDDDEIYFGTDPNDPDSDDNNVLDGEERRSQKFIHKVENEDCAVTEVIVSMEATGNLQKTTTVESIMNKDMLCTGVVGLVGEPFSIETTSDYEKATLTYVIDKSKLGDTEFDNLMFLWYDEKKDEFVELDTILDEENSTVSINTPHFSKYMLVDKKEWFDAWKRASLYFQDEYEPLAAAICYDCSGSMSGNDPKGYRKLAIDNFIDSMTLTDKTALISFEDEAKLVSEFSDNKEELKGLVNPYFGGGTNVRASVEMAIEQLNTVQHWYTRHIILLSDGDVNININLANNTVDDLIKKAVDNNIKIHTIGLGSGADNQKLKDCAEYTGGQYFTAETAEKLDAIYKDLSKNNHFDLKTLPDNDEDGLPDEFEVSGLVISNAQIFYTDPEVQDCDGDGLFDGAEILIDKNKSKTVTVHDDDGDYTTYSSVVFGYNLDPWDDDTDDDGLRDGEDPNPQKKYGIIRDGEKTKEAFQIVDDINYIPYVDYLKYVKNNEDDFYLDVYKYRYPELFGNEVATAAYIECLKAASTATVVFGDIGDVFLHTIETPIWALNYSFDIKFLKDVDIDYACVLLQHYLYGNGNPLGFDAKSIIESSKSAQAHYNTNLHKLMNACEETVSTFQTKIISTTDKAGFSAWTFNSLSNLFYPNELETYFSVNDCYANMVAECYFNGEYYYATVNYYIQDYYDFYEPKESDGTKQIGFATNDDYVLLALFDESKPFDVIGKYTREIMWKKGDSEFLYLD